MVTLGALIPILFLFFRSSLISEVRQVKKNISLRTVVLLARLTIAISVAAGALATAVAKITRAVGLNLETGVGQESHLSLWIVLCSCVLAPIAEEIT